MKVKGLAKWAYGLRFASVILILTGCSALNKTPTPLPTVVLGEGSNSNALPTADNTPRMSSDGAVTASAVVVPSQRVQLAFAASGKVLTVNAAVGDNVKA